MSRDEMISVPAWLLDSMRAVAVSLHAVHYCEDAPQWEPLDDMVGLFSQITNMVSGLVRPAAEPADAGRDAVAWITQEDMERISRPSRTAVIVSGRSPLHGDNWIPLYTRPPSEAAAVGDATFRFIDEADMVPPRGFNGRGGDA